jgi:2-(1,2-epoxy-1,2-dihydrophenyl)acetyl-CoA isomerase
MASGQNVLFEVDEDVGIVTLNRPDRLNAVHREMAAHLVDLFREIRQRDDVRAVVLTGAGRAFCAGADLSGVDEDATSATSANAAPSERPVPRTQKKSPVGGFAEFTRAIVGVDKPVIAAMRGPAVGAGLAYALAADRRIADPTVRVSAIFVRRGLAPDCGISYFLPRIAGLSTALKMATTGAMLDAEAAKEAGIIDELVAEGEALPTALRYAKELAKGASVAVDLARRGIYKSLSATLDEMLAYEDFSAGTAAATKDAEEGIQAFLEKRQPQFKGE